jgi:hypothetical protein
MHPYTASRSTPGLQRVGARRRLAPTIRVGAVRYRRIRTTAKLRRELRAGQRVLKARVGARLSEAICYGKSTSRA